MPKIEDIIKEVADKKGESEKVLESSVQLVVFDLDNEEYAVEIKDLQEIIKMPEITSVPGTSDFISGIFNLRGRIVVVIDLEKRFDLVRQTENKESNIIVTEVAGNSFGVIVDKVTEIINVPISTIQSAPAITHSKIQGDYLKGVVVLSADKQVESEEKKKVSRSDESRLIILLDLPKMLQEKELMSFSKTVDEVIK